MSKERNMMSNWVKAKKVKSMSYCNYLFIRVPVACVNIGICCTVFYEQNYVLHHEDLWIVETLTLWLWQMNRDRQCAVSSSRGRRRSAVEWQTYFRHRALIKPSSNRLSSYVQLLFN